MTSNRTTRLLLVSFVLSLTWLHTEASASKTQRLTFKNFRQSDQDGSATGYAYNDQRSQDAPVSYVQYTTHAATGPIQGLPYDGISYPPYVAYNSYPVYYGDYDYPPVAPPQQEQRYNEKEPLAPYYPLSQHLEPPLLPPYYPVAHHHHDHHDHHHEEPPHHHVAHPPVLLPPPPPPPLPLIPTNAHHQHHHHHHDHHDHHGDNAAFQEGGGGQHHDEGNSVSGERGEKGYSGHRSHDLANHEHRESDYKKGEYEDEAGHKGGHEEAQGHYDAKDEAVANQEGVNYGDKAYHKKGVRTSGFHNVYKKDEYKKDTDFYDEDHNGGHYEKYGARDERRKDEQSGYAKGDKHDSAYDNGGHGQQGHFEKGHDDSAKRGHEGSKGGNTYKEEHADYSKKGGSHHADQHGYHNQGYR